MVQLFILDEDAVKSAQAACDQHVLSTPKEVVQAALIVISAIDARLASRIPKEGECCPSSGVTFKMPKIDYTKRHMHPLPRWMALCRGNYVDALVRAAAFASEYAERFGKVHKSAAQLMWLMHNLVDFNTPQWECWVERERRGVDSKRRLYVDWFASYGTYVDGAHERLWEISCLDRNGGRMTHHPQIMDDDVFVCCRTVGDAVAAGRKHYVMKARGVGMKEPMRYLYRAPQDWLVKKNVPLQLSRKSPSPRGRATLPDCFVKCIETDNRSTPASAAQIVGCKASKIGTSQILKVDKKIKK